MQPLCGSAFNATTRSAECAADRTQGAVGRKRLSKFHDAPVADLAFAESELRQTVEREAWRWQPPEPPVAHPRFPSQPPLTFIASVTMRKWVHAADIGQRVVGRQRPRKCRGARIANLIIEDIELRQAEGQTEGGGSARLAPPYSCSFPTSDTFPWQRAL